jgi:alpha-beta hydrolase superfamily lysophospholipase
MNANCTNEAWVESSGSVARPIFFPSELHRLFGWLHMPAGAPEASIGLVICNPFGYEAICSHRSLRAFAQAAAAVGIPTLRFDYRGTGDSQDDDPLANQLAAWSKDVAAAVDELRRRSGVARVCLMGFRLGALVASLSAAACDAVTALIAIAPVTSGRRYVKELRTIQMAAGQKGAMSGGEGARALEVSGFTLSAATVDALNDTDLSTLSLPNPEEMLVVDRSESPGARPWADAVIERGAQVRYVALPGFVRMMMTAPHLSLVPQAMVGAARDWLLRFTTGELAEGGGQKHELQATQTFDSSERQFSFAAAQSGEILTETLTLIPGAARTFGIVTEPRRSEIRRRGIILLNAGATHHVGPNRMYVTLARRWAEQGYVVLRMDLGGLGDSPIFPGQPENEVYPANAIDDIRAAVDLMRTRYGITSIALGGLCSGAYHALRAAVAKVQVTRIIMVNPLNFFWRKTITQNDLTRLGNVHNPSLYMRQNIASRFWKKLLSGQVNVGRLIEIYAKYGYELVQWRVRDLARALRLPLPRDLGNELEDVASRGIGIVFLFARGDPGIDLLRHQGGSAVKRLGQRCRLHMIDGADHIFSQSKPRAALESIFSEELFARAMPAGNAASPLDRSHVNEEPAG